MMYQCRYIDYNTCRTPVGDVGREGGCACVGAGEYVLSSLYSLLCHFAVNLKLPSKIPSIYD